MESACYANLPFFWLLTRNQDFSTKSAVFIHFATKSVVFQRFATKTVVFQRVIHILMCFTLLKHAKTVYNTVKACYDAKTVFNTVKARAW